MRKGIMGTLAASALALVIGASPVLAENAHFVPSAWTGLVRPSGDMEIGYMVAGLGPDQSGYVRLKGWFQQECQFKSDSGNTKTWTRRAVERFLIVDAYGNARESDALRTNPCTNNNPTWTFNKVNWACVTVTLYLDAYGNTPIETKYFDDYLTIPGSQPPKCERLEAKAG